MDSIMEEQFSWIPIVKRGFLKSFNGDYEIGTLDLLQQNIDEEILKVQHKFNFKRARLLFECIDNFYVHFCRKWNHRNKFSSCMEAACVHILSSFIKISLLLSQGNKDSNWIYQVVAKIMRFPGKKNVIYDALLSVHCLNKKYKSAYGAILMHILVNVPLFVPVIINEPTEYLKVYLLVRRLKGLVKDPSEKAQLSMRASKILAPANLTNWLLAHDFSVAHTKTAFQRINLGINICKKLAGEKSELEVVETLRKILLPGICVERKAKDGEMKIKRNKTSAKNKKMKKRTNLGSLKHDDPILSRETEENINAGIPGLQKRSRKTKDSVGSEENVFDTADHTLPFGSLDNGQLVTHEKNRKRQKSIHFEENLQNETGRIDVPLQECSFESVKQVSKRNKRQKLAHETSQGFDEDSYLQMDGTEDVKQNADGRKPLESERPKKEKEKDVMVNDETSTKSKKKKRKQKEEMLSAIAKHLIIGNDPSGNRSLLTEDPQTTEITKRKIQKTKELDSNLKEIQSDAEDLPVIIVDEINDDDSDEPVIVTEVKHYSKFGPSSSHGKKGKPKNSDLNLNTRAEATIVAEEEFVIDSKPSPCHSESGSLQIMYDEIYDAELKGVALSEKPKAPIDNDKKLTSSVDLKDEMLPGESSSRAKIAEKIHTSEETFESCTGSSNSLINDHQTPASLSNLTSGCLISEKEASVSLSTLTDGQYGKNEDQDNVIDSNVKEHSSLINGTDEESSRDSAVQTDSLDYSSNVVESCINCKNIESSLTSEFPPQTEFKKGTSQENATSQGTNPVLESLNASLNSNNSPKIKMQKDDRALIETGEFVSGTSHSPLKSNTCGQEPDVQKHDHASIETDEILSGTSHSSLLENNDCAHEAELQKSDQVLIQTDELVSQNDHSSLKSNNGAQEAEVQKDDHASIEIDELVSDTSHSPLKSSTCAQEPKVQKDDVVPFENEKLVSGNNKVDIPEKNLINTEITEYNSTIVTSELPIKNSPVSCLSQKEKVTQENNDSETSSISSPTNTISYLNTEEISSQSLSETTSESANIGSSENENLEMQEKNGSIPKKSEAPLENSIPNVLESETSQQPIDNLLNTDDSSQETKIKAKKLISDNSSPNKIHPEVVSNSDSSCSLEIDCSDDIEDRSNIDIQSPSKNDSIHDLQVKQVTGLFIGAKSPVLVDLPEHSQILVNDKVMDKNQPMKQNQDDETENNLLKTPNSSAAKGLMDNMLKLVEIAGDAKDESTRKNILKGNFTSTLHSLSLKFLSSAASSSPDKKAAKCLSFLDISTESDHENVGRLTPECTKFLQYREFLNDLDDNRSEDTLSENKSISKTDASEYHSDASHDIESEDSDCDSPMASSDAVPEESSSINNVDTPVKTDLSLKNSIERSQLTKKENGDEDLNSQGNDSVISAKNKLLKVLELNPVVNLGERCDSESFVDPLSGTSELHTSSTAEPSSVVDEKLKDKMPSGSSPTTSTVNPVDEVTVKQNIINDLQSNSGELEKNSEESNTAKVEIQLEHKDVNELSLTTDHELAVSDKACESVEHTNEKDVLQDSECNVGRVLRKRASTTVESQKFAPVHEDSSVIQPTTPTSCRRSLRCRNPPVSSSQEVRKSTSNTLASGRKRSSKRFRKEVNLNLGFDFSTLSLDSPKLVKNKPNISSNESSSEVLKEDNESPTSDQANPCRRLTRASISISSNVDSEIKDQDIDPEGYNLRSRKSVIMPGKLKL